MTMTNGSLELSYGHCDISEGHLQILQNIKSQTKNKKAITYIYSIM